MELVEYKQKDSNIIVLINEIKVNTEKLINNLE